MSELERTILERLKNLELEVERLKSEKKPEDLTYFESLPPTATVGKDYVAYRFGCSERAVMRGEAGTHRIRRVSRKPLKFIKREVDAVWREQTKSVGEKAAEIRAEGRQIRRRSIITKSLEGK